MIGSNFYISFTSSSTITKLLVFFKGTFSKDLREAASPDKPVPGFALAVFYLCRG
jgi:hypothetical protein